MMNVRSQPLVAVLFALALGATAGCGQRDATDSAARNTDRPTDRMAANADTGMTRAASAVDDLAITTKIKSALVAEPRLSALQIQVETKDAVVTLAGSVDSEPLRARALEIAQGVEGVRLVVDHLVVKLA